MPNAKYKWLMLLMPKFKIQMASSRKRFANTNKYKIRGSDWLTFSLIIVNFNHFFIQASPAGGEHACLALLAIHDYGKDGGCTFS